MTSVKFLGHRVSRAGLSPDPERVRAIEQYTTPTDLSAVRTFLGKVSYYRRLILGFSAIAKGLTILTEKDRPFVWEFEQAEAFRNLKKTMVSHPILQHFNPDLDCEIHTDASTKEVGAVLIQKNGDSEHVVAYASKGLNKSQRNYAATQLELLAVVFGVEKFDCYVGGDRHFVVVTDHSALVPLLKTKFPVGRLPRFVFRLQHYHFTVIYRPGIQNGLADALSRYPCSDLVVPEQTVFTAFLVPKLDIPEHQREDPFLRAIILILEGDTQTAEFRYRILYYVLKYQPSFISLAVFGDTPFGRHFYSCRSSHSEKICALRKRHDLAFLAAISANLRRTYQARTSTGPLLVAWMPASTFRRLSSHPADAAQKQEAAFTQKARRLDLPAPSMSRGECSPCSF
ncbi:putative Retrovirus-related Pol polyprotein [Hypsibius exemplaris]|uniref:RNA-directed DNA polymerase n=1 Tax=Hypsibius exemplaris TaxID=2072580 RepID=A0A9X6NK01_HYPEX|nr:putative Retrovirus-related Pol polyprotein [Hypsibius exemplaris]